MVKKNKTVKAIRLLLIGQVLMLISVLCELNLIYQPMIYFAFLSFVGLIILFVSIFKLFKTNRFFLISFLCVCFTLTLAVVTAILSMVPISQEIKSTFDSVTNIVTKLVSIAFNFGIVRGCSKFAFGKANSKHANLISFISLFGKILSIVFTILKDVYKGTNNYAANALALTSVIIYIVVDICFIVYVFIVYYKSKRLTYEPAK